MQLENLHLLIIQVREESNANIKILADTIEGIIEKQSMDNKILINDTEAKLSIALKANNAILLQYLKNALCVTLAVTFIALVAIPFYFPGGGPGPDEGGSGRPFVSGEANFDHILQPLSEKLDHIANGNELLIGALNQNTAGFGFNFRNLIEQNKCIVNELIRIRSEEVLLSSTLQTLAAKSQAVLEVATKFSGL
jgi:hypothetical protein